MTMEIYTATGCARCKITKKYLQDNNIAYDEFDFKAEGKENFARFYRANRNDIFRDKDGVEFPVVYDGKEIRQGVSVILGYLKAGKKLDTFIGRSLLHGEWIDGFNVSGGDPEEADQLKNVLLYLKSNGLKTQVMTSGKNAEILDTLVNGNLCDRIIMEVKGPADLYPQLCGQEIHDDELKRSISLAASAPEYRFFTTIAPLEREGGIMGFLTPEEIGETARLIEDATGSKKHPYTLRPFDPEQCESERFKPVDSLPSSALFKYRTAARRYQVKTEIDDS